MLRDEMQFCQVYWAVAGNGFKQKEADPATCLFLFNSSSMELLLLESYAW